jgi:hypothetical protein
MKGGLGSEKKGKRGFGVQFNKIEEKRKETQAEFNAEQDYRQKAAEDKKKLKEEQDKEYALEGKLKPDESDEALKNVDIITDRNKPLVGGKRTRRKSRKARKTRRKKTKKRSRK